MPNNLINRGRRSRRQTTMFGAQMMPSVYVQIGHDYLYTSYFGGNTKSTKLSTKPYSTHYINKMKKHTTPIQFSHFYMYYIENGKKYYLKCQTDVNGSIPAVTTHINKATYFHITSFTGYKMMVATVNGTSIFLRNFGHLSAQLNDSQQTDFITSNTKTDTFINDNLGNITKSTYTQSEKVFNGTLDTTQRNFFAAIN